MDVNRRKELVSALADDELTGDEKDFILRWIATDSQARAFHQEILAQRKMFADFPSPSLGADFAQHISRQIKNRRISLPQSLSQCATVPSEDSVSARSPVEYADGGTESWRGRLARPRTWVYPLATLTIALLLVPLFSQFGLVRGLRGEKKSSGRSTDQLARVESPAAPKKSALPPTAVESTEPTDPRRHLTPPAPMAAGDTESSAPLPRQVVTMQLASPHLTSPYGSGISEMVFFLKEEARLIGLVALGQRRDGLNTVLDLMVSRTELTTLLKRLAEVGHLTESPRLDETLTRWLTESDIEPEERPVEIHLCPTASLAK